MENLYGDLVSDLCAAWSAGWASCPAATSATTPRSSKPSTARAPDIAGKGVANPLALIMSGVMMLNHIHEEAIAERIQNAYNAVLAEGKTLTRDLGGTAGTNEFADAIIAKLK